MHVQQRKWAGTEVSLQFPGLGLVSLRLWGVVFYCVAIVSVNEVQPKMRDGEKIRRETDGGSPEL